MKRFTVEVTRERKRWCEIVIEGDQADDAVADIKKRFDPAAGFRLTVWAETEARRVVEVGSRSRLLGITYTRVAADI